MIKFIYPDKDCTIYSNSTRLNTGADEIVEITADFTPTHGPIISRTLISFQQEDLVKFKKIGARFVLKLKVVSSLELDHVCEIEAYPVSESWQEGKGRFADAEHTYPGATWIHRNEDQTRWSVDTSVEIDGGGGAWFSSVKNTESGEDVTISKSYKFNKVASDVELDITTFVHYWTSGSIENHGILLKFKDDTKSRSGNIKLFSSNTNTIYSPYVEVAIFDYEFNPYIEQLVTSKSPTPDSLDTGSLDTGSLDTGSLDTGSLDTGSLDTGSLDTGSLDTGSLDTGSLDTGSLDTGSLDTGSLDTGSLESTSVETILSPDLVQLTSENISMSIGDIKNEYPKNQIEKMRVGIRDMFPKKKFSNRMRYASNNFVEESLYYSVRDAETEEVIIDHSEYTKISCDTQGHYFIFDFSCLSRGRLYKFLLKYRGHGVEKTFTDDRTFMIVS